MSTATDRRFHSADDHPTEEALVRRLADLAPLLAEHAEQAEQQRKPVDAVMAAIEETGAYRYFVPRRFGGFEYSVDGFMRIGMALGEGCISTAWVTTFCMEHNWLLSLFNRDAQEDIFAAQPYIIAPGALAPKGVVEPVDGGYRLSGQWQWGTGVMHADWVLLGAVMPTESGKHTLGMFALPVGDVEIVDTWYVDGMVGTGSNDIRADGAFVPAHRMVDLATLGDGSSPGGAWHDLPLYRMPMAPFLALTAAAPAVGGARAAVRLFEAYLKERTVYGTQDKQSNRAVAQRRLGDAHAEIQAVEDQLLHIGRVVESWGEAELRCPGEERLRLRLQIAQLVRRARNVVTDCAEACGASAHRLDNPLQRIHRDMHTLSCHTIFDLDLAAENYGRLKLGLEPNMPI